MLHEVNAALNAWDAAPGTTMAEMTGDGSTLSTSQRKLLAHATTEVNSPRSPPRYRRESRE